MVPAATTTSLPLKRIMTPATTSAPMHKVTIFWDVESFTEWVLTIPFETHLFRLIDNLLQRAVRFGEKISAFVVDKVCEALLRSQIRQDDHGNMLELLVSFKRIKKRKAVKHRHHQVKQDDVRSRLLYLF